MNTSLLTHSLRALACAAAATMMAGCGAEARTDVPAPALPDTLRVATLYSPASYFIYRDEPMGYDFALVSALAGEKGMELDLKVAPSLAGAIEMLDSGIVDLIAYEVPVTSEYKERVIACGPVNETTQVLVQPKAEGHITNVTELVGRDVYVEADSKYQQRMINLNDELGGGIRIHSVDRDTLITEDLIDMVASGEIPLTIVDSDIARINKSYFPQLDVSMPVSFPQRSAWAVGPGSQWLADSIDAWITAEKPRQENALLLKRYYERGKSAYSPATEIMKLDFKGGRVSPFDSIFRRHAPDLGWDWRLLAAQAYVESRFDVNASSWGGASGIMQVTASTARAFGIDPARLRDPEVSVEAAVKILAALDRAFAKRVPDAQERIKFVLAAYNSGQAHIYDAIEIAKLTGKDPQVWDGNVEEALLLKSNPEYYNAPGVKYGYFRGRQTRAYVKNVMQFFALAKSKTN